MNNSSANMSLGENAPQKTSHVLIWALVIAIIITLNLFFNYAISLIYKKPAFESFCPREQVTEAIDNKDQCVSKGGAWTEYNQDYARPIPASTVINEKVPAGYCDVNFTCQKNYESANKIYNRNIFIALVILGVLSLFAGFVLVAHGSAISLGLSLGGVLSLVIGSVRYWSDMQDITRVVILACALASLIWIGIKKVKN